MDELDDSTDDSIFRSRIFSTEVGLRPAEPCSVSVAATHQLLTNLFEYICVVILSDHRFRRMTAAVITETDLQVLEKCNRLNIDALCEITNANTLGEPFDGNPTSTEVDLRAAGDLWAEHILENAKAYIMTFLYIVGTVTAGYPLIYGIAVGAGLNPASKWTYFGKYSGLATVKGHEEASNWLVFQCVSSMQRFTFGCRRSISCCCVSSRDATCGTAWSAVRWSLVIFLGLHRRLRPS